MLLATANTSFAFSTYSGTFRPYWHLNGLYIEEVGVTKQAVPACATRPLLRLFVDPSTPEFKEQYAMLLAAWYSGRTLVIGGNGNCTSEGDEVVQEIRPQ